MRRGNWPLLLARALVAWVIALSTLSAFALDPSRSLDEYALEVWDTDTGLPHNQVHAIAQTPDGYLWFGTWEGLVRFNAREFRLFDRSTVAELADNGVRALLVDAKKRLWAGTSRGGLSRLDRGHWTHFDQQDGMISDEVLALREDSLGRMWVGLEEGGVAMIEDDHVRNYTSADGLMHNTVLCIAETPDGSIWFGTSSGLNRYKDGRITTPNLGNLTPNRQILDLYVDRKGRLYVGGDFGLLMLEGDTLKPVLPDSGLSSQAIAVTYEDSQGALWIGAVSGGLMRLYRGRLEHLSVEHGLPHNRVIAMLEDREGSMWVGTGSGLVQLKDAAASMLGLQRGLSDAYVRSVLQDRQGRMWVGTSNGLNQLMDYRFRHWYPGGGPVGNHVLSLAEDATGTLWLGTYDSGLVAFDGQHFRRIGPDQGLAGTQVRSILPARDGSLWVGTTNGLNRFQGQQVERFGREHGLPREYIFALLEDRAGRIWVGTTAGAAVYENRRFEALELPAGQQMRDVFHFLETSDGTIYAATSDGILRVRGEQVRVANSTQSDLPGAIFNLVEDAAGALWMGSNRGIYRVNRDELDGVLDGRLSRFTATQFDRTDGLANNQCNGGSQTSAIRAADGKIWFATAKGVAIIDPRQANEKTMSAPPVVIEDVRIDGRAVATPNDRIELNSGRHKIEVFFAGLSFYSPNDVRYRYRLVGYDDAWLDAPRGRPAVFTNLPPGRFEFEVSAAQLHGDFNAEVARLTLDIAPTFRQTPWFVLLVLAGVIATIWLGVRARTAQLHRRERQLAALVDERTQALAQRSEALQTADTEKARLLEELRLKSEAFEHQAKHDELTGLANRRYFDSQLARDHATARLGDQPLAVALVDVDHFKQINDRFGHQIGDEVLRALAGVLRQFQPIDERVARYGGEEFALSFPDLSFDEARARVERLRLAVAELDLTNLSPRLTVTVSIGLSADRKAKHHERLLADADHYLYEAKRLGRNRVEPGHMPGSSGTA
ncbi:hypothetical protein C7S18_18270 [Ahniella affigens]|uniref:diguanylate cyclase n=1 Tax=Ahniella affigens TaxID=2021234 RepID=A0A2P1PVX7_9GAMM|nr:ligand-binding sensor domain-containing diguanylate cyclase [Ahniella affigens]AVP99001.1 hypothetical protein C7S18_18270 [Ahniella affigens]